MDLAAKFCQQRKAANRLAMQQANANKAAVQAASQAASQTTTPSATTQVYKSLRINFHRIDIEW